MRHVEFKDLNHFENNYFRIKPPESLSLFIDFFWQTNFDPLWEQYPGGFSDALFPNTGYTYLINLGTSFIMQVEKEKYKVIKDSFLPRHKFIECFHDPGALIFGIKFKISPVILEKKINFSEYRESMVPLSYMIAKPVLDAMRHESTFEGRIEVLIRYYTGIIEKYEGSLAHVGIVSRVLDECERNQTYNFKIKDLAAAYSISSRTLQRYFEQSTSLTTKQTLQIMRIRSAVQEMVLYPDKFSFLKYGYYDESHFRKHLHAFLYDPNASTIKH